MIPKLEDFNKNSMAKYKITTFHDVYVDEYENGEGEHRNFYVMDKIIHADSPINAVKKYFDDVLYYQFSVGNAIVEQSDLFYSVLVNKDNEEASLNEQADWKGGKLELYANNIRLLCEELVTVKIY